MYTRKKAQILIEKRKEEIMTMKKTLAMFLTLAMVFALVSCSPASTPPSGSGSPSVSPSGSTVPSASGGGEDIVIGMLTPLTGDTASGGLRASQGAQMAVDEINAAGGVLDGRKLVLQIEDDQGNSDNDVQLVNKLSSEGAAVLAGPYFSSGTIAINDALTQNKIATINSSTAKTVRDLNSPWIFRARATDDINVQILAKAALDGGATKVAILCVNDEVGTACADLYEDYFTKAGIPFYREGHNTDQTDMTSTLTKAVAEGCDAYVMSTHNNAVAVIARQMYEMGIDAPVFTNPIIAQSDVLSLMEPEWIEGWKCVSDFSYTDERPFQKDFTERFMARYNVEPDVQSALYYGHIMVIADSIERAGSADRQAIRDAMAQCDGLQVPVGTVHATADEYTNMMFEISIAEIRDLTPYIVETVSLLD